MSEPTATTARRPRNLRASALMVAWLTAVWVLLWGDLTVANLVVGVGIAVLVTTVAPLPGVPYGGRIRPWGLIRLAAKLLVDLTQASLQIAAMVLWGRRPHGGVVRVRLRSHSDVLLTITAALTSLVPGSIVVEAHRLTGTLYVHVFDLDMYGGPEGAQRIVLDQEERVLRALASDEQMADAGLRTRSMLRAARRAALPDEERGRS
ncbi:Na+/H+ antiporter subunit E [Georgenia halophila]|uniref:Na+/H+ antiporter subunit E n=1 Tax=Georgenia halophila TaxID=620889 RepID=A0ABP8LEQ5_9MICO